MNISNKLCWRILDIYSEHLPVLECLYVLHCPARIVERIPRPFQPLCVCMWIRVSTIWNHIQIPTFYRRFCINFPVLICSDWSCLYHWTYTSFQRRLLLSNLSKIHQLLWLCVRFCYVVFTCTMQDVNKPTCARMRSRNLISIHVTQSSQ